MENTKIKTLISRVNSLMVKNYTRPEQALVFGSKNFLISPRNYDFQTQKIDGENNIISFKKSDVNNFFAEINGDNNKIIVRKGSTAKSIKISVRGSNNFVDIKENCEFGNLTIFFSGDNGKLEIGEHSTIWECYFTVYTNTSITVGKNCLFSTGIEARSGDGHKIIDIETGNMSGFPKDVTIEDHVWLCRSVKILKGVSIGKDSVIGFGSLCAKSIPSNCLAVGWPAEIKRKNIRWEK